MKSNNSSRSAGKGVTTASEWLWTGGKTRGKKGAERRKRKIGKR